jgi:integrase
MKKHFETISDPRQPWKVEHNLLKIVVMTICAVISGYEYWEDIWDFYRVKEQWFKEKLGLRLANGIASHDTFQRVFQLIDPKELEQSFLSWIKSVARQTKGEIISIDGKTVCRSRDAKAKAIHMVSAWANVLTDGEIGCLFNCFNLRTMTGCRDYAICALMLDSGLRLNEVITLQYGNVHITEGYVIVDGKGDKQRIVPLGLHSRRALLRYMGRVSCLAEKAGLFLKDNLTPLKQRLAIYLTKPTTRCILVI